MPHLVQRRPFRISEPAKGLRVALTGGIGAGKSTVTAVLNEFDQVQTISADVLGHDLFAPGSPVVDQVVGAFGPAVSDGHGGIDRAALASVVFASAHKRTVLESFTHPAIRQAAVAFLEGGQRGDVRIYDIPLFVETGGIEPVDVVIAVEAQPEVAVQRLVHDRGMVAEEAWKRIHHQASNAQRRHVADVVVVNDGGHDELVEVVRGQLWPLLTKRL